MCIFYTFYTFFVYIKKIEICHGGKICTNTLLKAYYWPYYALRNFKLYFENDTTS